MACVVRASHACAHMRHLPTLVSRWPTWSLALSQCWDWTARDDEVSDQSHRSFWLRLVCPVSPRRLFSNHHRRSACNGRQVRVSWSPPAVRQQSDPQSNATRGRRCIPRPVPVMQRPAPSKRANFFAWLARWLRRASATLLPLPSCCVDCFFFFLSVLFLSVIIETL